MASDAVGLERVSRVVGYKLKPGDFRIDSPNLPQRIAVFGQANEANEATLDLTPWQLTSLAKAGEKYGFGSHLYSMLRILKPVNGDGVGGIPIIVYPQNKAVGSTAKVLTVTPTGTATGNGVHTIVISGRYGVDGDTYDINIVTGDTPTTIAAKISSIVNSVLAAPVIGTVATSVATLTSKFAGLISNDINVIVDVNGKDLGVTYAVVAGTAGAGTPTVSTALQLFGNNWETIVVNGYGAVPTTLTEFESFNGIPDATNPTGRYRGTVLKPFVAIAGSILADPSSLTDSRKLEVTNAIAPAPLSTGMPYEAAANLAVLYAVQAQNAPHLDVSGRTYPDMPTPKNIGAMNDYDQRDIIVQKGCSTVSLTGGRYLVQDFVTTYHPVGENPPQFRYPRNLTIDFNVRYGYYLLEQINVVDHAIATDNAIVSASKVIKPKQWKQILNKYFEDLENRALIVDSAFSKASATVNIGTGNPDRLESAFKYKRSGYTRIASTDAEAGFNYGTLS